MNNKGFAITTVLFGTLILFCLLLISMLGILSSYRENLKRLIENHNGSRETITIKPKRLSERVGNERGLFCDDSDVCKYYASTDS